MAGPTDQRNPIELLGEEFLDRRRRGERVTVSQYASLHPDHSDSIRRLFPAMLALERFRSSKSAVKPLEPALANDPRLDGLEQLGDYRIIREIGRGGMGVVFEAEQQSLQRRVAVKVFPRQTLQESRQLARFQREACTAAGLHHTNIVPVFGVGEQDGLHYYVMQRILGTSLNEVIDGSSSLTSGPRSAAETRRYLVNATSTESSDGKHPSADDRASQPEEAGTTDTNRNADSQPKTKPSGSGRSTWAAVARIGIQVTDALDYAHSHGVVHRDIKPGNLVLDPDGTVWVTDFGLATVLETEDPTTSAEVAGTLRYMSPEQINGKTDARSDIYSLGLTLYELAVGRPALEDDDRAALLSKILSGTIMPPRVVCPQIPRDLQAIVMKAIARRPEERYQHAADLRDDLRRFVEGRSVSARPVNPGVRLGRWARRNRIVASLSAALLLFAIVSFAVIGAKWRESVAQNRRAEENLAVALESMDQILERFASGWMAHPPAANIVEGGDSESALEFHMAVTDHSAAVLQNSLKFYDQFAQHNPADPRLKSDTSKVHRRVGDIYQRLGQYESAEQAYRRSLSFLPTGTDIDAVDRLQIARTRNQLGLSMYATSRFDQAEAEFRHALSLLETGMPDDATTTSERARVLTDLAQCLSLTFRWQEARSTQLRAVQLLEGLVDEQSGETTHRLELARAYRSYHRLISFRNRDEDDVSAAERERIRVAGVQILEQLVEEFPGVPDYRCELSDMLVTTARRPSRAEEQPDDQAAGDLQRGIDLARELTQSHPTIPRYRTVLARSLTALAEQLRSESPEESARLFAEAIAHYRGLTEDFEDIPVYRFLIVRAIDDQAENLVSLERHADARAALEEAIEQQNVYTELRPDNRYGTRKLGHLYADLAECLAALGLEQAASEAKSKSEQLLPARG